jgi:hypothetical protein
MSLLYLRITRDSDKVNHLTFIHLTSNLTFTAGGSITTRPVVYQMR